MQSKIPLEDVFVLIIATFLQEELILEILLRVGKWLHKTGGT